MDSLQSILSGGNNRRQEPPEISLIKTYVLDTFQDSVHVMVKDREIVIICPSAALAGSLRMHVSQLRSLCDTQKRLVFRIG